MVGLAFSPDEKYIYASAGNDNKINIYKIENNQLQRDGEIVLDKPWPVKVSPAGLCATEKHIFVVAKDNNTLYQLDLANKSIIKKIPLTAEAYTCILSPDKNLLYISLWGGAKILIFDIATSKIIDEIANPNDMVLTKDGQYLYVSHGNDNTVSVIDTKLKQRIETLSCSLYSDSPVGSTPNGVTLSDDDEKLFIANADNNYLAVFEVEQRGKSHSWGFIPTGWYPTSVKTIGNKMYVTNGKGLSSSANPKGPNPVSSKSPQFKGANPEAIRGTPYIGVFFKGTLSIFDFPNEKTLADYSKIVYKNTPYTKTSEIESEGERGNPIPTKLGQKSPIKYLFYVIKENRTYDQVLGDVKGGNGDTTLYLFPERITPNQHAIVKDFVLLDNFYVDAEVCADGYNWSTATYANVLLS